ncbi:CD44 antigen-like [Syngnathoides biaculeatus]|uniref:CD44 antigen-like n=1 Tax=Syngnathoides biaculeatus TaxID=300417 RepID=UPI002ADE5C95|nr:CD44 antigen-like [Syngnathoides biaculeatus]
MRRSSASCVGADSCFGSKLFIQTACHSWLGGIRTTGEFTCTFTFSYSFRQGMTRMWTLLLGVTLGHLAFCRSEQLQVNSRSCSFAGVFIVEGEARHSLTFIKAHNVCKQLETTMANPQQIKQAFEKEMETCRNGWISNMSFAILRHTPHENCAMNMTGLIIYPHDDLSENLDAYCYDETAGPEINCDKMFKRNEQAESESTPSESELSVGVTEATPPPMREETTEQPTVESTSLGWDNNHNVLITFPVGDFDQTTGSGLQPPHSEEETLSTQVTASETDVTQPLPHDKQGDVKMKPENEHPTTAPTQQPSHGNKRMNEVMPESNQREGSDSSNWLVIIGVLAAVAAILFVCVAVAKRKSWCGKKQTLMITSKENEGNGAAGAVASSSHVQEREQEMVTLMNKEKIQENGNNEEFTVITLEETPDKEA